MSSYKIAEIAFDPTNPFPWLVLRSGTIAGQGGLHLGTESIHFESIEDACRYLARTIANDRITIEAHIAKKEAT